MQATLSRSPCAAAAQPGAAQRPAAQAQACLHGTAALRQRSAAAGLQGVQQRRGVATARRPRLAVAASITYGSEWSTPQDAYLTVGLSHCYAKNDDGKLVDQYMIEPITANSLECMANGGKTSFVHVFSLRLGEALARDKSVFPEEFAQGTFCEEYETRCDACARTWMRPHALDNLLDIVPLGQVKSNFNYSTVDKRVLNMENVVNDDDNIKQDLSIDVYGRKGKEEAAAKVSSSKAAAAAPAAQAEEEEDDMDALLSV